MQQAGSGRHGQGAKTLESGNYLPQCGNPFPDSDSGLRPALSGKCGDNRKHPVGEIYYQVYHPRQEQQ